MYDILALKILLDVCLARSCDRLELLLVVNYIRPRVCYCSGARFALQARPRFVLSGSPHQVECSRSRYSQQTCSPLVSVQTSMREFNYDLTMLLGVEITIQSVAQNQKRFFSMSISMPTPLAQQQMRRISLRHLMHSCQPSFRMQVV